MEQSPLDTRAYMEMKEVMEEVLPELLKTFMEYMPDLINDLNRAIAEGNPDLLFGIAHRMKSSCNSLGALGLAKIAENIEMVGRAGGTEGAAELSAKLEDQLKEVMDFFSEELKTLG